MNNPSGEAPNHGLGFAIGEIPGAAVYTGPERDFEPRVKTMRYTADALEVVGVASIAPTPGVTTWTDVEGVHDVALVTRLAKGFGLHPLVVEDIVAPGQRVKVERHEGYLVLVVQMLAPGSTGPEQLSLVLGADWVLTFQELPGDNFEVVRQRLSDGLGRVRRQRAAYLAYALLDAVVDGYAVVQKAIEDEVSTLEEQIDAAENPDESVPTQLHAFKRRLVELRRAVAPLREEVGRLARDEHPLIEQSVRPYFRDLYDHLAQVSDGVEMTRETARSLMELHLSNVSQKMNEDMRVLTVVATIFIPLTFLAGIYGMNFEVMPELKFAWAYPMFWVVSLVIVISLGIYFRRRRWL